MTRCKANSQTSFLEKGRVVRDPVFFIAV